MFYTISLPQSSSKIHNSVSLGNTVQPFTLVSFDVGWHFIVFPYTNRNLPTTREIPITPFIIKCNYSRHTHSRFEEM